MLEQPEQSSDQPVTTVSSMVPNKQHTKSSADLASVKNSILLEVIYFLLKLLPEIRLFK
jgi:hypothetical protein